MRKETYKARNGKTLYRPVVSLAQLESMIYDETGIGWCLACGSDIDGVEPDARQYPCPECRALKVYGMEELNLMGLIKVR